MKVIKRILRTKRRLQKFCLRKCPFGGGMLRRTWILMLLFLTGWVVVSQTQLMECLSGSLHDVRYILFLKSNNIKRGDIVAILGHQEDHVGELKRWPYSKRVLGLPGDHIVRNKDGIMVVPQESYFLSLLDKTSKGKSLTPIVSLNGPSCNQSSNIIPEGYFFVAGDNPQSFDSRYSEFGLVPIDKVWGKGIAKW